jgi:hypothetical protein
MYLFLGNELFQAKSFAGRLNTYDKYAAKLLIYRQTTNIL